MTANGSELLGKQNYKKSSVSIMPIFTKLIIVRYIFMDIFRTESYQNQAKNVENIAKFNLHL